jgi:hypothetical protein
LLIVIAAAGIGVVVAQQVPRKIAAKHVEYSESLRRVPVAPPQRLPTPSQEDIDLALALFSIERPRHLSDPLFDPELTDRGLTMGSTFHGPQSVSIGPAAFGSWALLGSTLAHEIEVHGQQNFFRIVFEDEFYGAISTWTRGGFALAGSALEAEGQPKCADCGTLRAEREAYEYEIANAARFGLDAHEVSLIRQVMDTYYPEPDAGASAAAPGD